MDDDRLLLQALLAEEAEECGGCHQQLDVSTDPKTMHTWQVKRITCESCRVLQAEVENDHSEKRPKRGVRYVTVRTVPDQ